MNDPEYFALDAINASLLKSIIRSTPAHADYHRKNPSEASPAMKLGSAFHAAILLDEWNFNDLIAVAPSVDRRTKDGKKEYAKFLDSVGDKTVITQDQRNLVEQMRVACFEHPTACELLNECNAFEFTSIFDYGGEKCKVKIDACDERGTVVDIKTTINASPDVFAKQSANYLYHMQLAWYAKALGLDLAEANCYIIAIENTPPHAVAVYIFDAEALRVGWHLCERAVREWKEYKLDCKLNDKSLAYGSDIHDLCLPAWADQG